MEIKINKTSIVLVCGDITKETTDAIVNAANEDLTGGGGVDGAIHRAGGPAIMAECRQIGGCPTGQAVITTAGKMAAKYVIHTVGPVYHGGSKGEADLLQNAYKNSLKLAQEKKLQSLSFPAISCGVYGYPIDEAARLAMKTGIKLIRHILFNREIFDVFSAELKLIQFS
jgi:O-acetyl-ADP-ribose deacetylase (regulator of RNase III)